MSSVWRIELLHPLTVHFPIAFLVLGVALRTLSLLPIGRMKYICLSAGQVLTAVGAATAWIAVLAGERAEEVVNRVICDPELTHQHGDWAEWASWVFTGVAALDLLALDQVKNRLSIPALLNRVGASIALIASWIAFGVLVQAAHLGVTLTYQLGAAVHMPDAHCTGINPEDGPE